MCRIRTYSLMGGPQPGDNRLVAEGAGEDARPGRRRAADFVDFVQR
jgi:hypothetical protein